MLAAIDELGYRPSRAATELASRRRNNVEVVIDDYRNLSFVELLAGIAAGLTGRGYHLSVAETSLNAQLGMGRPGSLLSTDLAGLIVAAEPDEALLARWTGPTVVAGWRATLPPGADLVANDDERGGRIAVEHLRGLGHRHIGHLTGAGGPARHRMAGYGSAMRAAGFIEHVAGTRGTTEDDGYRAADRLLTENPELTAIFAANDTMALGALAALRVRKLAVPADVSVVGYDNSPLARSRYLAMTSIDDRSDVVGGEVAKALLERIDDETIEPRSTLVEPSLVIRATTGPPPADERA